MLRAIVRIIIYTLEQKEKLLPILAREFKGWDQEILTRSFNFVIESISADGTVSEDKIRYLINEQRVLRGIKREVSLTEVAEFGPLQSVLRQLKLK